MKIKISSVILIWSVLIALPESCESPDKETLAVTDIEGTTYKTVRIGEQVWMAENLQTATYSDGTSIPVVADPAAWSTLDTPGVCWYDNKGDSIKEIYGALYNFYAVRPGKLCPSGWHVPSNDEWHELRDYSGDTLTAGGQLKEEGNLHWNKPNTGASNNKGFTALPAGIRYFQGTFNSLSCFASFWSSTEADNNKGWYFSLYYSDAVAGMNYTSKKDGFSVRCVKD